MVLPGSVLGQLAKAPVARLTPVDERLATIDSFDGVLSSHGSVAHPWVFMKARLVGATHSKWVMRLSTEFFGNNHKCDDWKN